MRTEKSGHGLIRRLMQGSLVTQIMIGLVAGIALAWFSKSNALAVGLLGELFVSALKAVAPLLVLVLVIASIANHQQGQKTNIRPIIMLYLLSTFCAAIVAVVGSHLLPQNLTLKAASTEIVPPSGILEVLRGLLMSMVTNPVEAVMKANYIGILVWAIGLGFAFR
ncbi:MAG TPA: serine/threonine transporter SstT, partial [Erwinia persicina]|nr:serine/threonine transporter SstT [Erwinia persicina]HBH69544.1 serine/threonine transporter SstT [Erwinia persicina]HBI08437.1 serine/threonine transporter SstT [Erwinia persicina]HBT53535.1 serine/threonine transporter SstT [Erwinia persicina]